MFILCDFHGKYLNTETNTCDACDTNCETCKDYSKCLSCPESYFLNTETKNCDSCDTSCLTCDAYSKC